MPSLDANGVTLTYQTEGDPGGPPLLLIMGLGMQLTSWPPEFIADLAARGFHIIRFDNRDSGLSTNLKQYGTPNLPWIFLQSMLGLPVKAPYRLRDMAHDALGLLDKLSIERCHVLGVSMGGMIAQHLAVHAPQRVRTLTSIMSSSGRRGLPGPTVAARKIMMQKPRNPRDREQVIAHYIKLFQIIGSPGYPTPEPLLRERIIESFQRGGQNYAGTARQLNAIVADRGRAALIKKIGAPSLIIHGSDDPLVPLACGQDTAARIPGATLKIIPGMGHDLPRALHGEMIDAIFAHCQRHSI